MSEQDPKPMRRDWQGRPICDECDQGIHFRPPSPDFEIKTTAPPLFCWHLQCGCQEERSLWVSEKESPWDAWERKHGK